MNPTETLEPEVVPLGMLDTILRSEIDVQIATAHRYPRSIAQFKKRALEMATMDEETAASCIYVRPVGMEYNKTTGKEEMKYAEGMSIRMAEIVGASYGNLRVGAMLVEQTDRQVKARGYAHDLEANFASGSEFIESTVTKKGTPFSERMRAVVAKACIAKARRDATFQVVPRALCKPIEAAARQVAIGDAKSLASRRQAVLQWLQKLHIDIERVWHALDVVGVDELTLEHLTTLTGLRTAIKDNETTIDEAFPPINQVQESSGKTAFTPKPKENPPQDTQTVTADSGLSAIPPPTPPPSRTLQGELSDLVLAVPGAKFETLHQVANTLGWLTPKQAQDWQQFDDFSDSVARRLLSARQTLVGKLEAAVKDTTQ